jgi:hypothetical protein
MQSEQKETKKSLQILLWLWFGVTTSFVATNVVNIAKIETELRTHKTCPHLKHFEDNKNVSIY